MEESGICFSVLAAADAAFYTPSAHNKSQPLARQNKRKDISVSLDCSHVSVLRDALCPIMPSLLPRMLSGCPAFHPSTRRSPSYQALPPQKTTSHENPSKKSHIPSAAVWCLSHFGDTSSLVFLLSQAAPPPVYVSTVPKYILTRQAYAIRRGDRAIRRHEPLDPDSAQAKPSTSPTRPEEITGRSLSSELSCRLSSLSRLVVQSRLPSMAIIPPPPPASWASTPSALHPHTPSSVVRNRR